MATTLTSRIDWAGANPQPVTLGTIPANWRDLLPPNSPVPIVAGVAQMASSIGFYVAGRDDKTEYGVYHCHFTYGGNWSYKVRDSSGALIQTGSYNFQGSLAIDQQFQGGPSTTQSSCNLTAFSDGSPIIEAKVTDSGQTFNALKFNGSYNPQNGYNTTDANGEIAWRAFGVQIASPAMLYQIPVGSTVESVWELHSSNPILAQIPTHTMTLRGPIAATLNAVPIDTAKIALFGQTTNVFPVSIQAPPITDMVPVSLAAYVRDGEKLYPYIGQTPGRLDYAHVLRNRSTATITTVTTEQFGAQRILPAPFTPSQFDSAVVLSQAPQIDSYQTLLAPGVNTYNGLWTQQTEIFTRKSAREKWKLRAPSSRLDNVKRVTSGWVTTGEKWRIVGNEATVPGAPITWNLYEWNPRFLTANFMATLWDNPDVVHCVATDTPGGGAVAAALLNKATFANGTFTVEKSWLFKRSLDGENWPDDADAVTVCDLMQNTAVDRFARPLAIAYDAGILTIADGTNDSYVSRKMGVADSWEKIETPSN